MLAARVEKGKAEGLRKYLKRKGLLSSKYRVLGSSEFIYFPLSSRETAPLRKKLSGFGADIVDARFKRQHPGIEAGAAHGYELYGSIAVIESDAGAAKKIAQRLMQTNKNIKTVLRKGGAVKGRYRTRRFVHVAGLKNYLATYRENGCVFRFDMRRVFFSTKLAYERKRVSELVKNGEKVIVMFAGVGPYSIEIAKLHKKCRVVSIELNAAACRYARENARLNKTPNVVVERGSVEKFAGKYARFADRIIMPLPKDSASFLPAALRMCAGRCAVHYYAFCSTGRIAEEIGRLRSFFTGRGRRFRLLGHRAVRPYSATEVETVIDFVAD